MSGLSAGATLRFALSVLGVGLLAGTAWYVLGGAQNRIRPRDAVVLAPMAGAEAGTVRLTDRLGAGLADLTAARGIPLRRLGAPVTEAEGSRAARALGDRAGAALIVWGYVTAEGSDAVATLIVEPRDRPRSLILHPFGDYAVEGTLAGPERFVLRQPIDGDAAAAVRLVDALLRYRAARDAEADGLFGELTGVAHPNDRAAFLLSRGHLALLMAAPQPALQRYDEVMADRSLAAAAHNGRGLAYAVMGQQPQALAEYEAAAALDSEDDAPLLNRGISLTAGGEYRQAISVYDAFLHRSPRTVGALVGRGVAWAALGDHLRAAQDFSRAIAIGPDPLAYFDRGLSDAARGQHREAIEDFSRALQLRPADPLILVSRGRSRSTLKDQTGAIADFTAALQRDPRMAAAYYERGIARTILGQHAEAIDDFSAAITLKPRFGDAYKGRGISRLLRREYPGALEDFERAIAIDPRDAEAYFQHGVTHRLRGEPRRAIPDMERVLEISRDPLLRRQAQEQLRQIQAEP